MEAHELSSKASAKHTNKDLEPAATVSGRSDFAIPRTNPNHDSHRPAANGERPTEMTDAAQSEEISLYTLLGGEPALRRLTRRMYELMATLPEAAAARNVHPPDLSNSEQKFFEFMSGWLGGPPLFVERRGPPMLRRRHFVARIGPAEIKAWLKCFEQAMDETVADAQLRETLREPIRRLAHHMQNTQPSQATA